MAAGAEEVANLVEGSGGKELEDIRNACALVFFAKSSLFHFSNLVGMKGRDEQRKEKKGRRRRRTSGGG